jgi:hypothetical protein
VVKKIFSITNSNNSKYEQPTSSNTSINTNNTSIQSLNQSLTTDYDMVLIKSPTNDIIILDSVPDTLDDLKYEVSDIRFFALYLKLHGSGTHIIELYKKDANYYVVGNKLDCEFFKYYLHNVLNVQLDNNIPFEYKLELMDENIKMVYVNETQSIVINKDGYTIVKSSTVAGLEEAVAGLEVAGLEEAVAGLEVAGLEEAVKEEAVISSTVAGLEEAVKEEAVAGLEVAVAGLEEAEPKEESIKKKEEALDASTVCY